MGWGGENGENSQIGVKILGQIKEVGRNNFQNECTSMKRCSEKEQPFTPTLCISGSHTR